MCGLTSQFAGFRFPVSGLRFQVSSFRFQVSGFKFQVSGFRFQFSVFSFQFSVFRLSCFLFLVWVSWQECGSWKTDLGFRVYQDFLTDIARPATIDCRWGFLVSRSRSEGAGVGVDFEDGRLHGHGQTHHHQGVPHRHRLVPAISYEKRITLEHFW